MTAGQDHGARFGLRGRSATIGRGPVMDIVLTDPRISPRHAEVRVEGAALLVEDLGSGAGTAVNGVAISGPTVLVPGDRLTLGATELTVAWTPSGSLPEPEPAPPAPASGRAVPNGRRVEVQLDLDPPAPVARPELLLPAACLALAAFALLATWMPALGDASGTDSLWSLEPAAVRVQAIGFALLAGGIAGAWLGSVAAEQPRGRAALAGATAVAGGMVAGLPMFLAAIDLPGVTPQAGVALLALAGLGIAGCAMAGLVLETRDAAVAPPEPGPLWVLGAGAGAGSVLAVVAAPLTWIGAGGARLSGVGDIGAGRWLVVLAVGVIGGCALAVAQARAGLLRPVLLIAVGTTAVAGAALAFVTGAALALQGYQMEVGLSLGLTGTAVAATSALIGAATLLLAAEPGPGDGSHTPPPAAPGREA